MRENEIQLLQNILVQLEQISGNVKRLIEINKPDNTNYGFNNVEKFDNEGSQNNISYIDENILIDILGQHSIGVKTYNNEYSTNEQLNNIALFMGNRFYEIKKVYEKTKTFLNRSGKFHLDMRNCSQSEISSSCQWCTLMYQIAFFAEYKYDKSPKFCIHAMPNKIPPAINFITGHWLELFVKTVVVDIINQLNVNVEYSYLLNPQIILPNGNDFELDVVFLINDNIFWIESKTGDYQQYIHKYSTVTKSLDINKEQSFLVLTDSPCQESLNILTNTFGMTVCAVNDFEDKIKQSIIKTLNIL